MSHNTCTVEGCPNAVHARGWCRLHYGRWHRTGEDPSTGEPVRVLALCLFEGCDRPVLCKGYCSSHYYQYQRGQTLRPIRPKAPDGEGTISGQGYRVHRSGGGLGPPVLEHRAVMEQMIGRPLLSDENVHHINGIRHDNRPENLELWNRGQPPGQRVKDLVAWAHEILDRYEQ